MVKRIIVLIKEDWEDLVKVLLSLFVLCIVFYVFSIDVNYRTFIPYIVVVPIIRHVLKNRAKQKK